MLFPKKIPLGDWLVQGGTILHVDLLVVLRYLLQTVVPFDLVNDPAHFTPSRFRIFVTSFIDRTSIRTVYCFKRVEVHLSSFLQSAVAAEKRSRLRPLLPPRAEDRVFGLALKSRPATLPELFRISEPEAVPIRYLSRGLTLCRLSHRDIPLSGRRLA